VTEESVPGPIDYIVIEFPAAGPGEAVANAMTQIVESGVVHLYDFVLLKKDTDESVSSLDPSADGLGKWFAPFAGARSGLLGDDDITEVAAIMSPGSTAAVIVYENAWAEPFVKATFDAGGEVIASARISAKEIMDALDALD
jgi:uncharacterized membrane protein